ncbi:RluA family pseudouridine synthase [bacterium]|nr:RluA family pseudouridine synthase [bacterium]
MTFSLVKDESQRADAFLSELLGISRSRLKYNLDQQNILLNGKILSKASFKKFKKGDVLDVEIDPLEQLALTPEPMDLEIVFEDADILVVNKPSGVVVHPAPGHYHGTLMNGIVAYLGVGESDTLRPGMVHRIDKNTSGLLVIAKNSSSFEQLSHLFAQHSIKREYRALIWGRPKEDRGTIETGHARDRRVRKRFYPDPEATRRAITHWEVLDSYQGISLITARLETGRTHQIRMHMKYLGHAVVNDDLYSGVRKSGNTHLDGLLRKVGRHMLHATTLGFTINKQEYYFTTQLPDDFSTILSLLKSS